MKEEEVGRPATEAEKECEICGAWFTVTNPRQKYCPDCRTQSDKKKKQMEREYARSRREYGNGSRPEPRTNSCERCGKEFVTWGYEARFCSGKCRELYNIETAVCDYCGKNLLDMGIRISPYSNWNFCSEECRWKWNEKMGNVVTCEFCGKRAIRRGGGSYCSKRCEEKAARANEKPRVILCPVCGKEHPESEGTFCSEACRNRAGKHERLEKERAEEAERRRAEEAERRYVEKNGLCPTCRRPYPDCERMQTNFRLSPKGAVFKGSIVVKCPKYVGPGSGKR